MYNEEQKIMFVSHECANGTSADRQIYYNLFNVIQQFEEKFHKDVCEMKEHELFDVIGEITGFRRTSKRKRVSELKNYIIWCKNNCIKNVSDDIFNIDIYKPGIDKVRSHTVANPLHLKLFLDYLFEDDSKETSDCIYRAYCWLAYFGIEEEDALSLISNNVILSDRIIKSAGKEYYILPESMSTMKNCKNLVNFRYIHPNYPERVIYKKRSNSDYFLRGTSDTINSSTYKVELSRRQKQEKLRKGVLLADNVKDLQLSYYRIKISGMFYRAYEKERAGIECDFMQEAAEFMGDKQYKVPKSVKEQNAHNYVQRKLANEYKQDYEKWKIAYSI